MIKNITNLINYNDTYSLTMDSHSKNYYKYMEVDENTEELVNTIMKTKYSSKSYGRSGDKSISQYN